MTPKRLVVALGITAGIVSAAVTPSLAAVSRLQPATDAAPVARNVEAVSTLFGSNAGGDHRAAYDPIKVQRVFFGGAPGRWGSGALAARIPTVVSFKLAPQEVVAGRHDAMLRAWFASMPTDRRIDWSYIHEPEDQVYVDRLFTAAQYRSAFARIQRISKEPGVAKANVHANLILMSFTLAARGRNWRDFYPDDDTNVGNGSPYVDVLAWDLYWGESDDDKKPEDGLYQRFGPGSKRDIFAVNRLTGDPIAVAEVGYDHDLTRAAVLDDVERMFRGQAVYVCYFDEDPPVSTTGPHALTDAASRSTWKRIVAR
jgi:hypothetical protein